MNSRFSLIVLTYAILLVSFHAHSLASVISLEPIPNTRNPSLVLLKCDSPLQIEVFQSKGYEIRFSLQSDEPVLLLDSPFPVPFHAAIENDELIFRYDIPVRLDFMPAGTGNFILKFYHLKNYTPPESRSEEMDGTIANPGSDRDMEQETVGKHQPVKNLPLPEENTQGSTTDHHLKKAIPRKSGKKIPNLDRYPYQVQLALTSLFEGDTLKARKLLQAIASAAPGYGWSRIFLGDLESSSDQSEKAVMMYEAALEDKSVADVAAIKLALEYQSEGRKESAASAWELAMNLISGLTDDNVEEPVTKVAASSSDQLPAIPNRTSALRLIFFLPLLIVIGAIAAWYMKRRADSKLYGLMEDMSELPDQVINEETNVGLAERVAQNYAEQDMGVAEDEDHPETEDLSGVTDEQNGTENHLGDVSDDDYPPSASWDEEEEQKQEPKLKKIEVMHSQGMSVKAIAEALDIGQDEVNMVLHLVSEDD